MSVPLPYEKEQRRLLGLFFKTVPHDPSQEEVDSFRGEHPDFQYSSASLLTTKRRQLLSVGVLSPTSEADEDHIRRYKAKKHHGRARHPAATKYITKRNCNRGMRGEIHY